MLENQNIFDVLFGVESVKSDYLVFDRKEQKHASVVQMFSLHEVEMGRVQRRIVEGRVRRALEGLGGVKVDTAHQL